MNNAIRRIDDIIEEKSLLKHQFYRMWSDGELTAESLAGYSKEYFQLVKAVPAFMDPIIEAAPSSISGELEANRMEETEHVDPWKRFAASLNVTKLELESHPGLPKTRRALAELASLMGSYDGGASAMYALEKEIPKISRTKIEGLAEFYGIADDEAIEYFKIHTEADVRHAASWQRIIEDSSSSAERLTEAADRSMEAQNLLLDACYEEYCG